MFVPINRDGKQAYPVDTRNLRAKLSMLFWERIGIPLSSGVIRGKEFNLDLITGEKHTYVNCTFRRCRFDEMKLIFIKNSYIEYSTTIPEFSNMVMCSLNHCVFKLVPPITEDEVKGAELNL